MWCFTKKNRRCGEIKRKLIRIIEKAILRINFNNNRRNRIKERYFKVALRLDSGKDLFRKLAQFP